MNRPRAITLSLLLIAAFVTAPASRYFTRAVRAEEEKKQKTPLHKTMEEMDEAMKKLKRTLRKADQNPESLTLIDQIIKNATECKELTPSKTPKLPEGERKKFVEDYHKSMAHLIETMQEMKKAVADGDNKKGQELYKSLKQQEEDGHDKFLDDGEKSSEKKPDKSDK